MRSKAIFAIVCLLGTFATRECRAQSVAQARLVVQTGHSSTVRSIAFSPNGRTLASGSDDNTIRFWDVATGRELRTLKGHSAVVSAVTFSRDGKTLASGSWDTTVRLWDVATGAELRTLTGLSSFTSVAFSTDGKTLAGGSLDKTIKIWSVATGAELHTLKGHSDYVNSVAFSSDGKTLASGSSDKTAKLWDASTGTELKSLAGPSAIRSVAFSPDRTTLAGGIDDNTVRLWDVGTGAEVRILKGHSSIVRSVAFSPDGKTLASGGTNLTGRDGAVKLWDVATGTELRTLKGHSYGVSSVTFSTDGKTLACNRAKGDNDSGITLWDMGKVEELRTLEGFSDHISSVTFSPDGKTLVVDSRERTELWNLATGAIRPFEGDFPTVSSVVISPDGRIRANDDESDPTLWDVGTNAELITLSGHSSIVSSVVFSPDSKTLVTASYDYTVKLWDIETGLNLHTLKGHTSAVNSAVFSPSGKTVASAGDDTTVRLWDVSTGAELLSLKGHSGRVMSIAFSPDNNFLVSGSDDGTTKLWNVESGQEICSLIAFGEGDWAVTTPEGRFDTNIIEDSPGLHWVISDDPLKSVPLEMLIRDYFEPKLLPRLIKCNKEKNCVREFKPVRDIATLNRVQPPVRITSISLPDAEGYVNVTVEVSKGVVPQKECRMKRCETGVYDLRVFRDGQMVGNWPGDGAEKLLQKTSNDFESNKQLAGEKRFLRELTDWQAATEVKPVELVKINQKTTMMTLPSFRVKLPRGKDVSQIEFNAYAFNEDRIKSETAKWQWPTDVIVKLQKAQPIKPRAYIIAVGVNAYENQDFDLEFAADDARRMSAVIAEKLTATGQYEKVTPVSLISDYETKEGRKVVTDKQATKDKFHAALDLLAGKNVDRQLLADVKNANELQKAAPDDLVLIMYSSHGYADRAGNFYFIPYDTGPGTGKLFTDTVRRHSISSDELSLWLRDVDAGEMIMIVDACHSAAAIEGSDFKPGPMGSRGLGQLSYDKGMKILTATQADNIALEDNLIKQGLLTYALIRDGIEARQADYKPKDSVINIREWLGYGVERVPKLYEEVRAGSVQNFGRAAMEQSKLVVVSRDGTRSSGRRELEQVLGESSRTPAIQQPSLFDFARKKREAILSISN